MSTLSALRRFIQRHDLIAAGEIVVVGVSGGADSLALLHALAQLAPAHDWRLHAAYLHHGLRVEADAEALFVAETAAAWGIGCTVERADVAGLAAQPGFNLEEAARHARYHFLGRTAQRFGAKTIAVGHHADDQAETVLMHLLRGSGLAGLRGMLPATSLDALRLLGDRRGAPLPTSDLRPPTSDFSGIRLIRPWLETPGAAILAYCDANALSPRFDASNTDTTLFRNRLRHEIVPMLRQINPRLTETLGRTAAVLQGDHAALQDRRRRLWRQLAEIEPDRVRLRLAGFRDLGQGDQRALLRRAIAALRPDLHNINWQHTEILLDHLAADPRRGSGGPYPLVAGLVAWLNYDWLDVESDPPADPNHPQIDSPILLALPGVASLGPTWQLRARQITWPDQPPWTAPDPLRLYLPLDIPQPLRLRSRRPGDRMSPFGLGGCKALTDLMTEHKLPRPARAAWPLLVDADDRILWLLGRAAAEAARLPAAARSAWELRIVRSEE